VLNNMKTYGKFRHHLAILTGMDDFAGEEKKSLHYGETEGITPPGAEQSVLKDETLGGGSSSDREEAGEEIRRDAVIAEVDRNASLNTVRSELHQISSGEETPIDTGNAAVTPALAETGTAEEKAGPFKKLLTATREGVSGFVYGYLGDRTPGIIKNHVPVYRTVDRRYAGSRNQSGTSEWTIGSGAKKHAKTWVENHKPNLHDPSTAHLGDADAPEVVAIKSTLGELGRHGDANVTHYGEYGSARKKVVLNHADQDKPIRHTIISSNKHNS
jgi:hypothetical protein